MKKEGNNSQLIFPSNHLTSSISIRREDSPSKCVHDEVHRVLCTMDVPCSWELVDVRDHFVVIILHRLQICEWSAQNRHSTVFILIYDPDVEKIKVGCGPSSRLKVQVETRV